MRVQPRTGCGCAAAASLCASEGEDGAGTLPPVENKVVAERLLLPRDRFDHLICDHSGHDGAHGAQVERGLKTESGGRRD
eukprot:CAMPEP_0202837106 /NCGR_PEP_ID=MMETSP1389-20130828/44546_1 /ASSEMBLY_ACC=CAM_ASM_000865 /TAXON_ID=302021 /ORGANISM="Rhodomonas sp., Strain CCMP768" /LENGTH=79 /DNA_ID=CAMNT_0049513101 /DNA_START=135 /DNA_END=374 /DNA_ORIENTATION=-